MKVQITGVGVLSALGTGSQAFNQAVIERKQGFNEQTQDKTGQLFSDGAYVIPDFNIVEILGKRKGTRVLDRTAALAVGSSALAIRDRAGFTDCYGEDDLGVALGTVNGSISQVVEFLELTRNQADPWMVSPEGFPNTVMNFAAGQTSIWHQAKAVNTTIVGGTMAGILSLRYAQRMLEFNHAKAMLAGSVEEHYSITQQAQHFMHPHTQNIALGEGGAMFVVEQAGSSLNPLADLLACEVEFTGNNDPVQSINQCIYRALDKAQVDLTEISAIVDTGACRQGEAEQQVVNQLASASQCEHYSLAQHTGYCVSATSSLQTAALIALLNRANSANAGIVITSSASGNIGVLVLKGHPRQGA